MSILLKPLLRGTYARTVRTRSAWGTSGEFRPSGRQPVPINSAIGRDTLGAGMADAQLINWLRPVLAHYLTDPAPSRCSTIASARLAHRRFSSSNEIPRISVRYGP